MKTARNIHGNRIRGFSKRVLEWFERSGRKFPWREKGESVYRRVVTEVLLQRTRAETIAQFYESFFSRYPDWDSLACATVAEIEVQLKPIGMWRQRAPRLKAMACAVIQLGCLPSTEDALRQIPAVGQYVANAALLFQGISAKPLLDAGMARVLERYFGKRGLVDIRYDPYLQSLSGRVVSAGDPIKANWAILDLAAIICRTKRPRCVDCPLEPGCLHRQNVHRQR